MKPTWNEVLPGDTRDPDWLNDALNNLATVTAGLTDDNFAEGRMRVDRFSERPASRPVNPNAIESVVASAWPASWGPLPGALATTTPTAITVPARGAARFRLAFDFITTAGNDAIPAGVVAHWRIASASSGWSDSFSEGQLGHESVGNTYNHGGSAFSEAWYFNDTDTDVNIGTVRAECYETTGATIQAGNVRLDSLIFRRV